MIGKITTILPNYTHLQYTHIMKTNNTAEEARKFSNEQENVKTIMAGTANTVAAEMDQAKESWFEAAKKWAAAKWDAAKLMAAKLLVKAAKLLVSLAEKADKVTALAATPIRAIWRAIKGLFSQVKAWLASQSMALFNEAAATWRRLEAYANAAA